jgi:ribonuclease HII
MERKYKIGIDEVGRGALAGPVMVGVAAIPFGFRIKEKGLPTLQDSKKLSEKQREEWFSFIKKEPKILFETARVNVLRIDKINITQAANLAAFRAILKLVKKMGEKNIKSIVLDGGLFIKNRKFQAEAFKKIDKKTLPKADEKFKEVMLASIMAKVKRDKYMKKLHKKFPEYGFDRHAGYGTKFHREKIKLCGVSLVHRRSFCKFLV